MKQVTRRPYELQAQMYPSRVAGQNERGNENNHIHEFAVSEYTVRRGGVIVKHVKLGRVVCGAAA